MTDAWDNMITGDDEEVAAEIAADANAYARHFMAGRQDACRVIAEKYGLFDLPPQQVSEHLVEMSKPSEGGVA